jgi:hypothetical protein
MSCVIPFGQYSAIEAANFIRVRDYLSGLTHQTVISMWYVRLCTQMFLFKKGQMPTMDEIIIQQLLVSKCQCLHWIPSNTTKACLKWLLSETMEKVPECREVVIVYSFYNYYGRLPYDVEEFLEFLDSAITTEAPQMEEKKSLNLEKWHQLDGPVKECSLCFSDVLEEQKRYQLPCGHIFHASEQDCLEGTVAKWFTKQTTCPNCRLDLSLSEPGPLEASIPASAQVPEVAPALVPEPIQNSVPEPIGSDYQQPDARPDTHS